MARWFCIPPANYLFMMENWHTHMVIAPHLLHNAKYCDFYCRNPNLYTMLDNGLWEGQMVNNRKLSTLAKMINADEIIAPDNPSGKVTVKKTMEFLKYLGDERENYRIHGAIHGENYDEQLECLEKLLEMDLDVLDMPKMLGPVNREKLVGRILDETNPPAIHFLGYYKEEWDILRSNRVIRSFDTSVPFKPKYGDKFKLELPYSYWTYLKFKWRTDKWRRMFYEFKTTPK